MDCKTIIIETLIHERVHFMLSKMLSASYIQHRSGMKHVRRCNKLTINRNTIKQQNESAQ